jgi:hypothetical protein
MFGATWVEAGARAGAGAGVKVGAGMTWTGAWACTIWLYEAPCNIIFAVLILAFSSSARAVAVSFASFVYGQVLCTDGHLGLAPLAAGGMVEAVPPPGDVSRFSRKRHTHVPQQARRLGDFPLAVVGHKTDLGVLVSAV